MLDVQYQCFTQLQFVSVVFYLISVYMCQFKLSERKEKLSLNSFISHLVLKQESWSNCPNRPTARMNFVNRSISHKKKLICFMVIKNKL